MTLPEHVSDLGSPAEILDRWLQHYDVEPPFGFFSAMIDDLNKLIEKLLKDQREEIASAITEYYAPVRNIGTTDNPIPSDPTEWDEALHLAASIARGDHPESIAARAAKIV